MSSPLHVRGAIRCRSAECDCHSADSHSACCLAGIHDLARSFARLVKVHDLSQRGGHSHSNTHSVSVELTGLRESHVRYALNRLIEAGAVAMRGAQGLKDTRYARGATTAGGMSPDSGAEADDE